MRKLISMLLACLMLLSVSAYASGDPSGGVTAEPAASGESADRAAMPQTAETKDVADMEPSEYAYLASFTKRDDTGRIFIGNDVNLGVLGEYKYGAGKGYKNIVGFFVGTDQATLWRGGMASNALKQLIGDTLWGELDYLVLDTPPGTSDIHLTLIQTLGITGAVIVSTPQQVALADARKGVNMYMNEKVNVPILGLVENMAWFTPARHPDERYYIFGKDGVRQLAEELNVPLVGQIPLVQDICESGDQGIPAVLDPASPQGVAFMSMVAKVVTQVDRRNVERAPTERVKTTR